MKYSLAILSILLSGALYGCLGLFGIRLVQQGMPLSHMLFWRFLVASLSIAVFTLPQLRKLSWSEFRNSVINALLYACCAGFFFYASMLIGTGLSMVLFYSYPVFIFLYMAFVLKEPISKLSWLSLITVCVGFILLNPSWHQQSISYAGLGIGILSSVSYAAYILASKDQSDQLSPSLSTFVLCALNTLVFFAIGALQGPYTWPATVDSWLAISAVGIVATSIPILLMLYGLKYVGADLAGILSVFEPVVTVILGVAFLNESLNSTQYLGIGVLLLGATGATLSTHSKEAEDVNGACTPS